MSDDGIVNVEEDGPAIVQDAPPAAPPVAEAPELEATTQDGPEDDLSDPALLKDEGKLRAILAETSRVREQNRALKVQAARVEGLEQEANALRPYKSFLEANPDILKPRQQATVQAPTEQRVDPEVEQLARTLDLYTPEGQPDLKRAGAVRTMMAATAQQIAQQHLAPVHEQNYQTQSARNFQLALTIKDADGRTPSQESLAQIWRSMPAHQTADPNVASILALTAMGLDRVQKKGQPAPPAQPPIVTEGAGGGPRRPALSQLESNIARDRGISESKWAELNKGFVPGRATQLED